MCFVFFRAYLHGPPTPNHVHTFDLRLGQGSEGLICDIRLSEHVHVFQEQPRHVEGYVALAYDDRLAGPRQAGHDVQVGAVRVTVVPPDELAGRVDALEGRLAGDPQLPVLRSPVGEENGIIVACERGEADAAVARVPGCRFGTWPVHVYIAEEGEIRRGSHLFEFVLTVLRCGIFFYF